MTSWVAGGIGLLLVLCGTATAGAQLRPGASPALSGQSSGAGRSPETGLRARFGTEIGMRLAGSLDPDERLRGIERVAATHTPEALALLERAVGAVGPGAADARPALDGLARTDPRALLVIVRALATWLDREDARAALASIVTAPTLAFSVRPTPSDDPGADEATGGARVLLARQQAAIALAESGNLLALDALIVAAKGAGPGQVPALDALAIHPPAQPLLAGAGAGISWTTPATIALAASIGDLRSLDSLEGTASEGDPALRAAALAALGLAGDWRVLDAARSALHDPDARVRVGATGALVRLGARDAPRAVEALAGDDTTAIDALNLAQWVQDDGVTKAAAARAAAAADPELRALAVTALGRQEGPLAVAALAALVADAAIQGDAACALARSPSAAAMAAVEKMASAAGPMRRLAARAYLVRRLVRGERSEPLEALLRKLAASKDVPDRALGVHALVALGQTPVASALDDPDPRVRRAAALGAIGQFGAPSRNALLTHAMTENDEVTRHVLAIGLLGGDPDAVMPTTELLNRARGGGPDAPLAAQVLAQRGDERYASQVDALLASPDPLLRAHAARGLGSSAARDAVGRLAAIYATEADVEVRRAVVDALSARTGEDAEAPARQNALWLAARLDPDRAVRWTASRALSPRATVPGHPSSPEVSWLRLAPAEGATLPQNLDATLVTSNGLALPIAFDEDGYALVVGVAPGEARVRLAPRPPAYEAPPP
jgi:HEAT repeat protein